MTIALTNQRRVFKACLTQTDFSDDVTRKIGPLDFINWFHLTYLARNLVNTIFPRTKSSVNQGVGVLQFEIIFCSWDGSFVSFLPLPPAPVTMDFYLGSNFLLLHRDLCTEGRYNKTTTFIKSHLVSSRDQKISSVNWNRLSYFHSFSF